MDGCSQSATLIGKTKIKRHTLQPTNVSQSLHSLTQAVQQEDSLDSLLSTMQLNSTLKGHVTF